MTLGHPLVDAAIADLRLGVVELRAFRVLWGQLDFERFQEKKSEVLGAEIGTGRSHASTAMRRLVDWGYIEAGPRNEKSVGTYRLPRTAPAPGAETDTFARSVRIRRQIRTSL